MASLGTSSQSTRARISLNSFLCADCIIYLQCTCTCISLCTFTMYVHVCTLFIVYTCMYLYICVQCTCTYSCTLCTCTCIYKCIYLLHVHVLFLCTWCIIIEELPCGVLWICITVSYVVSSYNDSVITLTK